MEGKIRLAVFGQKRLSREGGIEIVVKELCTRMAQNGCEVTCYNRAGHHVSGAEYDKTIEYDGIRQKVVPTIEKKGLAAVSSSFFAALCSAFGRYDVVHSDFNGELRVGCVCAEHMTDDYINPQKSERELKNRLNRKKNFMRREWQERAQGKYVLRYKGENITIMKSKFGAGWGVLYGGQSVFRYNNRRIDDFHTARLIAFDLFDEQHESRGEVQPYWDGMRWLYY